MSDKRGKTEGSKKNYFKKGNKASVGKGRPKDTIYQKLIKGQIKHEFYEYMFKSWHLKLEDVEKQLKDTSKTLPEQLFLRWFVNKLKDPSHQDIEMIAKLCGVKFEHITIDNLSSDGSMSPKSNINLTDEQQKRIAEAILKTSE